MNNHPIPQDVTGFQFKLIGDMTVKQFAYIAAGGFLGYLALQAPVSFILALPFMIFFPLVGIGLAFVPISGRPMDVMLTHFLKALIAPNQYIYQKSGGHLLTFTPVVRPAVAKQTNTQSRDALAQYLESHQQQTHNALDEKESSFFQSLSSFSRPPTPSPVPTGTTSFTRSSAPSPMLLQQQPVPPQPTIAPLPPVMQNPLPPVPPASPQNSASEQEKTVDQASHYLQQQLQAAKQQEALETQTSQAVVAHERVSQLQEQLNELANQKTALQQQLQAMAQKLEAQKPTPIAPTNFAPTPQPATPTVRTIPKTMGAKIGLPITPDVPNVLTGIVKDPRGNVLPHILIEVKDKEGTPIRAFKTNTLGQFASATPILNGEYTIELEDPSKNHKFDRISLVTNGEIILPLEITSTDAREELRRDLFGA